jgi:NAD(P)-dependent dehydrogenase (short-subunit alcohol dehydrogenase family)
MTSYPTTPSFRLDGKRALVTGASRGIGLGGAIALAEAGAHVILAARSADALNDAVGHLTGKGLSAEACVMDVTDIEATQAQIGELGPFDILFNNAGIARHTPMTETTVADFDDVIEMNVKAVYFVSQAVFKGMIAGGIKGSIIHTTSQMGVVGGIDRAVYCTTKFGIEGLTKAMAIEAGRHGIRVNTLAPTFIRTPLAEQSLAIPERKAWVESMIKLGRVGEIEDIMGPVVFLASDASALMTGATLLIDGGWTAD